MGKVVLIVEADDGRRAALRQAFQAVDIPVYEVGDAVDAMVAIGRAEFGALVASEGRRQLSLRGLCHLARRSHPGILTFVLGEPARQATVQERLGGPVTVLAADLAAHEVVEEIAPELARSAGPRDLSEETEVVSRARGSTTSAPSAGAVPMVDSQPHATELYEQPDLASMPTHQPSLTEFSEETLLDDEGPAAVPAAVELGASLEVDEEETILDVQQPVFSSDPAPPRLVFSDEDEKTESVSASPSRRLVSEHDTEPAPFAPPASSERPLFEGELGRGDGASLLMGIYAQEVTGRLEIEEGRAAGDLFFYGGEPVAARHPLGDAGLTSRLVARAVLQGELEAPSAPEGLLLSALVAEGRLRGNELHEFLREFVRDRVMDVIAASAGAYRFVEDASFLLTTPLLKVHPFGLIVESRRRSAEPARLMREAKRLGARWLAPTPALRVVSERLRPFTRGVDLASAIGAGVRVNDLFKASGFDSMHGALLVKSLLDAHLCTLSDEDQPRAVPAQVDLAPNPTVKIPTVNLPDSELSEDDLSADEVDVREHIFSLYVRMKPMTRPAQVLGVSMTATTAELKAALDRRLDELDPERVPAGSAQALLISRVEELRAKVKRAYEALKLQADMNTQKTRALDSAEDDNPW